MSDYWRMTASKTAQRVRAHEISALEVVESTLERLASVNPAINAVVVEMPEEARNAARAIDAQIARGDDPGPLAGVPVTIKENVDQKNFPTTNGLRLQNDFIAKEDNPVVANLRKAGAIIVGRTNTPAFSLHWFTRNSLRGHTRNPHNSKITPGGSSGGAAAATAAGIGAIGHGTDIAGSIRYPAYACGIHGLRPTLGRIPAINLSGPDRHIGAQLMAVSGPLARTIEDVRLGFHAMAAEDPRDPWWTPVPLELPPQPKRAALAIDPEGWKVDPQVEKAVRQAGKILEQVGWTVEEVDLPPLREAASLQAILWLSEFRRSAAAMIEQEADPDAIFIYEQMARLCPEVGLNEFLDVLQKRVTLAREWQLFLNRYPVLICPVSSELPFPDLLDLQSPEAFDRVMEAQLTQIAMPFMGLPGLTVTTGMAGEGTPVGVQLIGARFREDTLLAAGEVLDASAKLNVPVDP